jgi:hypothetical protein
LAGDVHSRGIDIALKSLPAARACCRTMAGAMMKGVAMATGQVFLFMFLMFADGQYVHTVDPMASVQACEAEEKNRLEKYKVDDNLRSITASCFRVTTAQTPT